LGRQGVDLYDAGRWAEALTLLQAAEKSFHAPTLVLYMARCEVKLGRLLEAEALYQWTVAEDLPHDAPRVFVAAQAEALAELEPLRARIPTLLVEVRGAGPTGLNLAVDGNTVTLDQARRGLRVNPGTHQLELSGAGPARQYRTAKVSAGENNHIVFVAALPQVAPKPQPAPGFDWDTEAKVVVVTGGSLTVLATALGVYGAIKSSEAASEKDALASDPSCARPDPKCADQWDEADGRRDDFAYLSMGSFLAAGAALAGTGIYVGYRVSQSGTETRVSVAAPTGRGSAGLLLSTEW